MSKKIILGLVGEIASGKGTVAKYLENKYTASIHRFSTPLRDILNRIYLDIDRKNMQTLSTTLREAFGQDLLAKIIGRDADKDPNPIIVIDGIRRFADIKYLKDLPEFNLVYVTAKIEIRYERLIKRGENEDDNNKTFEQFLEDHKAEPELEIPKIGKSAKLVIDNSKDMENLYTRLDEIVQNA